MSDDLTDLVRPEPPRSWRDHASAVAESLDLTPRRLILGLVVLLVAGLVGWRLLAPAEPPPEMGLPFASPAGGGEGAAGDGAPGDSAAASGDAGSAGASADDSASGAAADAPGSASVSGAPGASGAPGSSLPAEVVVHVAGAVGAPGVQRLPGGSRVVDAVEAAGGASPDADLGRVNLAVALQDGQQVYVPRVGEVPPVPVGPTGAVNPAGGSGGAGGTGAPGGEPINVNTASVDELDTLPGVGPATAAAIVSHREQNGPFVSVDQLLDVRGIGDAKLEQLRDLVTV